jgi:oxygen-dependent protoporphyrinogen oxidase
MHDSIIIGAGISGLGVAARLAMQGNDVLVLEKALHVGGTMTSERLEGYLIDFGPTTILHTTPLFDDLVRYAGLEKEICFASAHSKQRFVVRDGAMHALPMGPGTFLTTRLFSFKAKMRLLQEPFISKGGAVEESIGDFTHRRLGREFLEYAIGPFVSGVYAGDPSRLSVQWAFPKIHALEHNYGSLIKGAIKGARDRKKRQANTGEGRKDTANVFSFVHGNGSLPEAIAAKLGQRVVLGCEINRLMRDEHGFEVTYDGPDGPAQARGRCVILAIPAYALDPYMRMCNPQYPGGLDAIEYAPVVQIFLGFRRQQVGHPLQGFGVLIPHRENNKLLGVLWMSSFLPFRAPTDHVALTAFLGGMLRPDMVALDEEELLAICLEELATLLDVRGEPQVAKLKKWPRAIPQYTLGYGKYLSLMETFEANTPGAFLCGNFRGGIAVGDCVMHSAEIASKVTAFLSTVETR